MTMTGGMQLSTARLLIECSLERMTARNGETVFDEWALVRVGGDGATLAAYQGPRAEQFRSNFLADVRALRSLLAGRPMSVGEFAFAPEAEGTAFDACVRIGEGAYLLLITRLARWNRFAPARVGARRSRSSSSLPRRFASIR